MRPASADLYNLQQVDLGYAKERLLIVEVDARDGRLRAFPPAGVVPAAAGAGALGAWGARSDLFEQWPLLGSDSGDQVVVEGYTPKGDSDRSSRYNHVGPHYFSTLGIPLLARPRDHRTRSAIERQGVRHQRGIREAFFAGRNPLGMHVTQVYANQRNTFEVVGVARHSRGNNLRGDVEHRYYVPAAQPIDAQDGTASQFGQWPNRPA